MNTRWKQSKGGFSLIELLAAVAIMMMIVGMMAMLFGESNRSWTLGTNRAENNNSGRAALQLLTHDLQYAVADNVLSFALLEETTNTYEQTGADSQFGCDELRFVSLKQDADNKGERTAREVYYFVSNICYADTPFSNRFALMRGEYNKEVGNEGHAYSRDSATDEIFLKWYDDEKGGAERPDRKTKNWATYCAVVAENVAGFAVYVPDPKPDAPKGTMVREYKSDEPLEFPDPNDRWGTITQDLYRLPPFADVYLEVLDESAAKQLSELIERSQEGGETVKPSEQGRDISFATFIEKNSRRYTTRVHFHNGHGYQDALRLGRPRREKQ